MILGLTSAVAAHGHTIGSDEADNLDPFRRSGTLASRGGRPGARSRARPLTACCARHNGRAAERWEVRKTRVRAWTRPAGSDRGETCRFAGGRHGTRTGRRRECITRRPGRTIGRLCCSIARTLGVRYRIAVAERQRNDPDAKPVCGTPRAGRKAAGSVHPQWIGGDHQSGKSRPTDSNEGPGGLQADGPEASTQPHDRRHRTARGDPHKWGKTKNKTNNNSNNTQSGLKFARRGGAGF
jgi:hypothetical protein